MRVSQVRSFVSGGVFIAFAAKIATDSVREIHNWHQQADLRDTQTTGQITNVGARMSDSGQSRGYTVSYEFVASAEKRASEKRASEKGTSEKRTSEKRTSEKGAGGGSSSSAASEAASEIEDLILKQLQNSSQNPSHNSEAEAQSSAPAQAQTKPSLPKGQAYFRQQQIVNQAEYNEISIQETITGTVSVSYEADNPSNAAITIASNPPEASVLLVPLLLASLGSILLWMGFRQKARS